MNNYGVDRLFVDEAHYYKNLFFQSKMKRVSGVGSSNEKKSSDMFMKTQYMDEITRRKRSYFCNRNTNIKQYCRVIYNAEIPAIQYIIKT